MGDAKGGYATRCESVGVREYVQRFRDELSEDDLTEIVDHCDKVEEEMIEGAALFLDDDIAPDPGGSDVGNRMAPTERRPTYKYRGGHAPRRGQQGP